MVEKSRSQLKEAHSAVEELETTKVLEIAAAKQQMHSALEENEAELAAAREGIQSKQLEKEQLLEKVDKLEQAGLCSNFCECSVMCLTYKIQNAKKAFLVSCLL